ncbi:LysR family transcriptional regulator [Stutzerimonas stutzeri]|uniref:LysR family transcriptional regulator n=1 Tax=Stutzerimonas stutzeri TaxID=316 RepID=UPI000F7AFB21|nr:LysR family transcriptional regulator [Stutzerimonas stutzeri]MDH0500601.1 LysR family transcriptional regulator [Stutzerimonas stutzeri]RRW00240.1 LysR family transcriptional regulator [Stutzerimonas stutzeri]WGG15814.1 LysR family transcriptional regulator [Stutzerimonas stutzeri]
MDISFRQLQAFVLIAEHRSFSRAAEQVHLSQPALSYSLRKLEDALGLSLLARNTRSVELTAAGLRFLEQARRLLRDMDNAVHDAHEQLHLESGSLRIAVLPSVAIEPLPRVLQEYRRRYPGIDISLHDGRAGEIRQWVSAAEVDFAITSAVDDLGALDFQPLYDDSLVLLVRGHERLRGKALLAALREQDYIATTRDTSLRSMADETLQRMGLLREPAWEVAYMSSAAALARAGLGFALLPASVADTFNRDGSLAIHQLDEAPARSIGLLQRKPCYLSPPAQVFVALLQQQVGGALGTTTESRDDFAS